LHGAAITHQDPEADASGSPGAECTEPILHDSVEKHFSAAGLAKLQQNLPDCRIIFDFWSHEFPVRVLDE